jgi:hypothetical protein
VGQRRFWSVMRSPEKTNRGPGAGSAAAESARAERVR